MNQDRIMNIVLAPHVSEKTSTEGAHALYAFKVRKDATKPEIRQAVEKLFNVTVQKVTTTNVKTKAARFGRIQGRTKGWKKAYVTLKEGKIGV